MKTYAPEVKLKKVWLTRNEVEQLITVNDESTGAPAFSLIFEDFEEKFGSLPEQGAYNEEALLAITDANWAVLAGDDEWAFDNEEDDDE